MDECIVIRGESAYGTYLAVELLIDHYVNGQEESVLIPQNLEYYGEYYPGDTSNMDTNMSSSTVFYRPDDGGTGDVIPIYHDGLFYVFYLHSTNKAWCYVTITDFVTYSDYKILGFFGGTGDVLYVDGTWHLFAAQIDRTDGYVEVIHHYSGSDLHDLQDSGQNIIADGVNFTKDAWRDPRIWYDESIGKYRMIVCTNSVGDSVNRTGCVAYLTSDDLWEWELGGTYFHSHYHTGANECPDYFKIGDWYYLLYSCCTTGKRTYYVKSQSPNGPWEVPDQDTFDSVYCYAAKTASDGENRYIFGWAGDRLEASQFPLT